MKNFISILILLSSVYANACPIVEHMRSICGAVASGTPVYRKELWSAACITDEDDANYAREDEDEFDPRIEDGVVQKVQILWSMLPKKYTHCEALGVPGGGHVFKYAVQRGQEDFLRDITRFKLDLNVYDSSDQGRTVLDFVYDEMKRREANGDGAARVYRNAYIRLKHGGAKCRFPKSDAKDVCPVL